jgi:hypothetical protein
MSNSILSIGSSGVQAGFARANEAANNIVKAGLSSGDNLGDLASSIVDLKVSEQLVKASAQVIKTADETVGTLIDIKA